MKLSAKTRLCTFMVAAALVVGGHAFAQRDVSTDSSTTTDTTTNAGMKGADSVRPADGSMGSRTVERRTVKETDGAVKNTDNDSVKSGATQSIDQTQSRSSSTTDDSQK